MSTLTFQQGASSYAGARDTHICGFNPTFNRGANGFVEICEYTAGTNPSNALLYFDLSGAGFTGTETVTSATLTLKVQGNRNGVNTKTISIAALRRGVFQEGSGTGVDGQASAAGDVNFTYFSNTGIAWTTPGGFDTTNDKRADESSTSVSSADVVGTAKTWSVSTMVQNWINSTWPNYGMIMTCTAGDGANGTWDFYSKEDATVSNRPLLTINYTTGGGTIFSHLMPMTGVG